jgi:hypothetical protein
LADFICGAFLDMRDLNQMLAHIHDADIEIGEGPLRRRATNRLIDRTTACAILGFDNWTLSLAQPPRPWLQERRWCVFARKAVGRRGKRIPEGRQMAPMWFGRASRNK